MHLFDLIQQLPAELAKSTNAFPFDGTGAAFIWR